MLETQDRNSKVVSTLEKGEKVKLIGRTTGPKDRLIEVISSDGKKGFVSEEKIQFDWGM